MGNNFYKIIIIQNSNGEDHYMNFEKVTDLIIYEGKYITFKDYKNNMVWYFNWQYIVYISYIELNPLKESYNTEFTVKEQ